MSRDIPNASEMGKRGGTRTFEKRGSAYMSELAKKGRLSVTKNDPDYYKKLSASGLHAREVKRQAFIKENIVEDTATRLSRLLSGK